MNAITTAVRKVMRIPEGILRYGLIKNNTDDKYKSLDSLIINKVIRPIVMMDMNLYGSNLLTIELKDCEVIYRDNLGITVRIPKKLTNHRSIVTCNDIVTGGLALGITTGSGSNSNCGLGVDMKTMNDNMSPIAAYGSSNLTMVGENTVHIDSLQIDFSTSNITCIIENDAMLNNISTRNYGAFSKLVVLAVKSYIYTETILGLDSGYIELGHNSDGIRNEIEKWADAAEEYDEYFNTKWKKISFINDKTRKNRLLGSMFGNNM